MKGTDLARFVIPFGLHGVDNLFQSCMQLLGTCQVWSSTFCYKVGGHGA